MTTKKNDFVGLSYTGYSNGEVFDSNIDSDLKKLHQDAKPKKLIVSIGQGMVVAGLDKALEEKEIGNDYEINLKPKEAFGERDKNLLKTIPLKVFTGQNIMPRPGMVLNLDSAIAKVVSVSGARVITDFNNPLASKDIKYKFKILRIVTDDKEKAAGLFENFIRFVPNFEVNDKEVIITGDKNLEVVVKIAKDKFKELLNKDLILKIDEKKSDEKTRVENSTDKK